MTDKAETTNLPSHLVPLGDGQWAFWRWVGLRGAGFPAVQVLELAAPECGQLADQLIQAEDEYLAAQQASLAAVNGAIESRWTNKEWDSTDKPDPLVKTMRALKKGKVPAPSGVSYAGDETLEAFREALARYSNIKEKFHQAFAAGLIATSSRIIELAKQNKFREAVTWQNRHAFNTGIAPILNKPPARGERPYRVRHAEELIASLANTELIGPVDTKFQYSNLGFNILGLAVERIAHEPYADYVTEHILQPLGMKQSGFAVTARWQPSSMCTAAPLASHPLAPSGSWSRQSVG